MIDEIYIDNFRCLTNFRIRPAAFQLWLGDNGSGKSTVFDVLRRIQLLLRGAHHVEDIFDLASLTLWDQREQQAIKVSMTIENNVYEYHLIVDCSRRARKVRIGREELKWNGATFFLFDGTDAHLYRINHETNQPEEGVSFSADWSRSLVSTIADREDNWPLSKFREAVSNWLLISPVPHVINQEAEKESRILFGHAENFAEWYRYVLQEKPNIGYKAKEHLEDALPGFEQISLKEVGKSRYLTVTFRINDKDREFEFNELSDGQRQLIILYIILEALRSGVFSTLFIDEPDNFVSLREIQPWVDSLQDICDAEDKQAIIVSHHPEIINKMARGEELLFLRQNGGHTIIKSMPENMMLLPAEIVARGWEDE